MTPKGCFTQETKCPWPLHVKHSHRWKRRSRSEFTSHCARGTNGICKCKMDVKVCMDSYMASNGSCFIVTLTVFKNHLLEVGLTQNREIMAIQTLTTVDLFYFIIMILEVSWDSLWTLSFGLSQFHGHGSWHVCDMALTRGHFTQGPKVMSTKLWEPKRSVQGRPNTILKPYSVVWGPQV